MIYIIDLIEKLKIMIGGCVYPALHPALPRSHFDLQCFEPSSYHGEKFQAECECFCWLGASFRYFGCEWSSRWVGPVWWHPGSIEGWSRFNRQRSSFGGCSGLCHFCLFVGPNPYPNVSQRVQAFTTNYRVEGWDRESVFEKQTCTISRASWRSGESKLEGEKVLWICQNENSPRRSEHSY